MRYSGVVLVKGYPGRTAAEEAFHSRPVSVSGVIVGTNPSIMINMPLFFID